MPSGVNQQQNNSFHHKSGQQTPNPLTSAPMPRLDSPRILGLVQKRVRVSLQRAQQNEKEMLWYTSGAFIWGGIKNVLTLTWHLCCFTALFYSLDNVSNNTASLPFHPNWPVLVKWWKLQLLEGNVGWCSLFVCNMAVCQCTEQLQVLLKLLTAFIKPRFTEKTSPNKTILRPCCLARLLGHILYFVSRPGLSGLDWEKARWRR